MYTAKTHFSFWSTHRADCFLKTPSFSSILNYLKLALSYSYIKKWSFNRECNKINAEVYLKPSPTSTMELFTKIVHFYRAFTCQKLFQIGEWVFKKTCYKITAINIYPEMYTQQKLISVFGPRIRQTAF